MKAFNILTEFRFDIAHAMADSKALQNQVGLISDTANKALYSLQRVGFGLVAQMGLFQGGVLGFLHSAIQASEKFGQSQRKLANVFLSNQQALGGQGMTFLEAMQQSEKVMENIRHKSFEFALDPTQLLSQTSAIAPMLLSHGFDNRNLTRSIDMSRGLLKSAPTLGIDPSLVQGQMINLVLGRAGLENTLFQRLMSETQAFRENKIVDSKSYNSLAGQKRIDILTQALLQFGSNAEVIAGNIDSLTGQMTKFWSLIRGQFAIVKPLGDALLRPIIRGLKYANEWLDTNGRKFIASFTTLIQGFLDDPMKAIVRFYQVSRLRGDTELSKGLVEIYEYFRIASVGLALFGLSMTGVLSAIGNAIRSAFMWIVAIVPWGTVLSFAFSVLKAALADFFFVLAPLIFLFQIFSATLIKLKIIWATWMASNAGRMADVLQRIGSAFAKVIKPITEAIDGISDILAGLLGWFVTKEIVLLFLEKFADGLEWLGGIMISFLSIFAGVGAALGSMVGDLQAMRFEGITDRMGQAYDEGAWDYWKKVYRVKDDPNESAPVSQNITNIGKVEVNQSFKEQMEPDRIAFAFTEQLKKIAMNPSQAVGRTSAAGLVGQ